MNKPEPYQDGLLIKIGKFIGMGVALLAPQVILVLPQYTKLSPALYWPLFAVSYFLLYWLYLTFYHRYATPSPQRLNRKAWVTIVYGYLIMFVAKTVFVWLNTVVSHQATTENDQAIMQMIGSSNRNIVVMTVMMGVFFAPLAEELLYRGVLMNMFFKHRFWPSVILSAVLFGLSHANNTWTGALVYIVLGGILAFIYKKTNNLKITIVLHFLNNLPLLLTLIM